MAKQIKGVAMSWVQWNSQRDKSESVRSAFREYVMADLAGDLRLKLHAVQVLRRLGEMPRPALMMGRFGCIANLPELKPFLPTLEIDDAWNKLG